MPVFECILLMEYYPSGMRSPKLSFPMKTSSNIARWSVFLLLNWFSNFFFRPLWEQDQIMSLLFFTYHVVVLSCGIIRVVLFFRWFESFPVVQVETFVRHEKSCFTNQRKIWDRQWNDRQFQQIKNLACCNTFKVQCWHLNWIC